MKTKAIKGYVYDSSASDKRKLVKGRAFQTPGREWFRMWATPSIESIFDDGEWIVSHWDSGTRVTEYGRYFATPHGAIKDALEVVASKTDDQLNEALRRWYSGEAWPGK